MVERSKIVFTIIIIIFLIALVVSNIPNKIDQQSRLEISSELDKMESSVRELGVGLCYIQPYNANGNDLIVMIHFWQNDLEKISKNFDKIRELIFEYSRKSRITTDPRTQTIKYLDEDGFSLENTLKAELDILKGEIQPEYFEMLRSYRNEMREKLDTEFLKILEPGSYNFKIIADVSYDVTLNTYITRKIYFYMRFKDASLDQLQQTRIIFKKISGFNADRGDKIYFYNLGIDEYQLVERLRLLMQTNISADTSSTQTIIIDPAK